MEYIKNYKYQNRNIMVKPKMHPPIVVEYKFYGFLGKRLKVNEEQWLLKVLDTNPALIEIFRLKELDHKILLDAWSGEYPGKLLEGLVLCWRLSKNINLHNNILKLINSLKEVQGKDGYLGPFSKKDRFFGKIKKHDYNSNVWDLWGHYHCMLGLFLWYRETGDKKAFNICLRAADLICNIFLDSLEKICKVGCHEMNFSIIHIFCLLYEYTGIKRYREMVNEIEKCWSMENAPDYLNNALDGKEFYETPAPRWESLHNILALAELYYISGEEKYRKAFIHIYKSILKYDRHNTGSFSTNEKAIGNPYLQGAIETCSTVAWIALNIDMIRLTGESIVADELELSTFNSMLGAQAPSGKWWTYSTPMDGQRKAFYDDHNWQCLPGGPELNCCFTNAANGLGMISEWAVMVSNKNIYINYFGPGIYRFLSPSGNSIEIVQKTQYPLNGKIEIKIQLKESENFNIFIRIPRWSINTTLSLNNRGIKNIKQGHYLKLNKLWKNGDLININLDMSLHFWLGERECEGKTSVYYGPILLTLDQRFNKINPNNIPVLNGKKLKGIPIVWKREPVPWLLLKFEGIDRENIILCDFASAGSNGTWYKSWLKIMDVPKRLFINKTWF